MAYGDYDGPNKPDKGKEGGSCNRTRCQCAPANWYNNGSYAWYCIDCKRDIESANRRDWARMTDKPMFETRAMMTEREESQVSIRTETHAEKMHRKRQARDGNVEHPKEEVILETVENKKAQHRAMIERLGMKYTEIPETPTPMDMPKVHARMKDVVETTKRCPDIYDSLNDFDLGNVVRMLTREDHGHEGVVVAARNRIWTLSKEKEALTKALLKAYAETSVNVYLMGDEFFITGYENDYAFTLVGNVLTQTNIEFYDWHAAKGGGEFKIVSKGHCLLQDYLPDDTVLVIPF